MGWGGILVGMIFGWVFAGLLSAGEVGLEPGKGLDGDAELVIRAPEEGNAGDWCETIFQEMPVLSEGDGFVERVKLSFLYHHQFVFADGRDRTGRNFSDSLDENRRFWWGLEGRFGRYFTFKAVSSFSRDLRARGEEWGLGHENFRGANVVFDAGEAFGLDFVEGLELGYGRRSIRMTDGWRRGAARISTVERADFSNKMWPNDEDGSNPLAAWVKVREGISTVDLALVSTDEESWLPEWDEGVMAFASWEGDFSEMSGMEVTDVWLAGFYQFAQASEEQLANGVEWAVVGVNRLEAGRWAWHHSVGVGENGGSGERDGLFWGWYTQPMVWLVKERLRLVLRYQYQGSEGKEGIRLNRRYARVAADSVPGIDINGGRGDEHHSFYVGLNFSVCGENAKVVSGVLFESLESDGERVYNGWTTAVGLRVFF